MIVGFNIMLLLVVGTILFPTFFFPLSNTVTIGDNRWDYSWKKVAMSNCKPMREKFPTSHTTIASIINVSNPIALPLPFPLIPCILV